METYDKNEFEKVANFMKEKQYAHREICGLCHRANVIGFHVPNDIWEAVVHHSQINSIHCLSCFTERADEKLIDWSKDIKFYPVSLRSHIMDILNDDVDKQDKTAERGHWIGWLKKRIDLPDAQWQYVDFALKELQDHNESLQAKIKALENDLLDALDLKECKGPTALSILSARVKALEEQLKEVPNRKRAVITEVVELRAKVKLLEERLQAADEYIVVVTNDVKGFDCASHVINKMNEVLGKYQSLKK